MVCQIQDITYWKGDMSEISIQESHQPSIKVHLAATLHMFTYYVHSLHYKDKLHQSCSIVWRCNHLETLYHIKSEAFMTVKADKILLSYKSCQWLKITNVAGTISVPITTFTRTDISNPDNGDRDGP